jgi:ornithine cyclodeaminase/alanine dehydrogenase-like protein (mu-crystallin family)
MVLLIRDEDVRKVVTPEDVIEAVENVYRQHGLGKVQDTPRREVRMRGKDLPHLAAGTTSVGQGLAYLGEQNVVMISHNFHFQEKEEQSNVFPPVRLNPSLIHVIDAKEGKTLAIIRSPYASWMRTSAAGAVGFKYLARKESKTVGVIGTGLQGKGQLFFLSKVMKIENVFAHSGRRKDIEFAEEMGSRVGIDIQSCDRVESVVRDADVLVTATRSTEPLVRGDWVKKGTHINSIGADDPHKVELDAATLRRADKVVVDSDRAIVWIGQIMMAVKRGALKAENILLIGQVVAGIKPGREKDDEITIFSCEGSNMQTAGVAFKVYERVKRAGLGIETSSPPSDFLI